MIPGPNEAGKTFFLEQILAHHLLHPSPSRVIYVNGEHAADLADEKHLYHTIESLQVMKIVL